MLTKLPANATSAKRVPERKIEPEGDHAADDVVVAKDEVASGETLPDASSEGADSSVTGPVLFNNCGRESLVDMEGREVTVPLFTSEEDDELLCGGQRLGHAAEVNIPACAENVERNLS
ncbi:hypothetical protein HPB50_011753 [Hyalomma asiaticum]|uniref:Uncharacterized protein n=1 Tax=Hyalomma asiaticum TaxID=266040 RepID=A0ACB7RQH1_HYAAI|nr:hypothetical protein HPB50_011753 [Hyalomma asiaticum]